MHKNILRYVNSSVHQLSSGVFEVLLVTAFYPSSLPQLLKERNDRRQRMTEAEVLRIICDISEAVSRLHHCLTPIIHRDLKVENILIDERQNFVLCDFGSATSRVLHPAVHGIARCEEEIATYTTLAYRAPEMIDLYLSIPLGPQIDIWAMGCILYCICFAVLPFGESTLAIVSSNFTIPHTSPYTDRLHKLIGYLLSAEASKRPDIFQASALAFSLADRQCPVENLNHLVVPDWDQLPTPLHQSQQQQQQKTPGSTAGVKQAELSAGSHLPDSPVRASRQLCDTSASSQHPVHPSNVVRSRPRASGYPPSQRNHHPEIPALVPPPGSHCPGGLQTPATSQTFNSPSQFQTSRAVCDESGPPVAQLVNFCDRGKDFLRGHYRNASDGSYSYLPRAAGFTSPPRQVQSVSHLPMLTGSLPCSGQSSGQAAATPRLQISRDTSVPEESKQGSTQQLHSYLVDPGVQEVDKDSLLFGAAFDAIRRIQASDAP